MPINPEAIFSHKFAEIRHSYVERDAILYALGIGLGEDPLDTQELRFLIETELALLPTMAVTLGSPGMWVRDKKFGIDVGKLVHTSQAATFHAALPPRADIIANAEIVSLADRGEGKGAVLVLERKIRDAASEALYCTLTQTLLLRGDGGFGGKPPARASSSTAPERPADHKISFATSPRAALIYRLSGDWNPLHSDPQTAQRAGFPKPILHGLASYGIAGWVILKHTADAAAAALASLSCRFAGVIYPGDVIEFSVWQNAEDVYFEASVGDRKVLDQGSAKLNFYRQT